MRLLNEPHNQVEHLIDRFAPDTQDTTWLPAIAADPQIIVISADPAITRSKKEREIWRSTGLTSFFFSGGFAEKNRWIQTLEVVRWWPEILRTATQAPRGTGYLLPLKGSEPKPLYEPRDKAP